MADGAKLFEGRARSSSYKLPAPVESDGKELEFDVREDEEQNVKLQQCIDLLVAAGYFRARIKGLSPFDKIVGGMTWCITTCNVDIDVDLLFQENSTIGQKIALTERIVKILPKMSCPRRIEPHQIQGLDFIHIYPVMQWLVKRAMETRAEMGDYIRAFSISQFHKNHMMPQESQQDVIKQKALATVKDIKNTYRPQRRFRHHDPQSIRDEGGRVQTTLLEYGRQYGYSTSGKDQIQDKDDTKKRLAKVKGQTDQSDADMQAEEEKRIQSLISGMTQMTNQQSKLTASAVGQIVGMQTEEIQQIANIYASKKSEIDAISSNERVTGTQQHARIKAALEKQIQQGADKLQQLIDEHDVQKKHYEETLKKLQQINSEGETLDKEMAALDAIENEDNSGFLSTLRGLVALNETLKKQEQQFKTQCKEEMGRLKDEIKELQESDKNMSADEKERMVAIEAQYDADKARLQKIRLLLAKKNREISSLQRRIDDVPTRAELAQYQKRFVELYNQVSTKHTETKQFYTLYNTLDDKKLYLEKEVNLLNSVYDNFTQGMSSPAAKEQYLKQFEKIVEGVVQNKIKAEKKKQSEKQRRDQLNDEYLHLIEQQRLYFKTVKDFKQECHKNEVLQAKIRELSSKR